MSYWSTNGTVRQNHIQIPSQHLNQGEASGTLSLSEIIFFFFLQRSFVYWVQQLWSVYINNMQNPTAQCFILTKILKTQKKMEREGGAPTTTGISPGRGLGNSEEGWGHIQCTSSSFRWLSSLQITIRGLWEGLNKLNYTHKELRTGLSD